ncbi:hypothetical protein R6Q57_015800 [Mikania cordata]
MVNEADPGWTYGTLVEGTKNSLRCNFCNFVSSGRIIRHKHHLVWDSLDVSRCPKVPLESGRGRKKDRFFNFGALRPSIAVTSLKIPPH